MSVNSGYHRLWSHRSYNASLALQVILILAGASSVQGSCYWWARMHRAHHRHTDTDLDPYNANRGLLWTHIGWMIFKCDLRSGTADISDLRQNPVVQWQHRYYFPLVVFLGYILPSAIPGIFWNDWAGGFYFAGCLRLTVVHHVRKVRFLVVCGLC
jgi:stearoyl-CoA desaturase (delta-9 desaturase)